MRACIFCRSTTKKRSGEHTFSKWIGELYPKDGRKVRIVMVSPGRPNIEHTVKPFTQEYRGVCDPCNTGWMERLESAVGPYLGPMIVSAKRTSLTAPMQAALAAWAVKTAFVLQKSQPPANIVPESEYDAFYAVKQPHNGIHVWLGWRDSIADSTGKPAVAQAFHATVPRLTNEPRFAKSMEAQAALGSRAYRLTFGIDHVAFQVFGHTFRERVTIGGWPDSEPSIWPVNGWPIDWPPEKPIDQFGGIEGWHQYFVDPDKGNG